MERSISKAFVRTRTRTRTGHRTNIENCMVKLILFHLNYFMIINNRKLINWKQTHASRFTFHSHFHSIRFKCLAFISIQKIRKIFILNENCVIFIYVASFKAHGTHTIIIMMICLFVLNYKNGRDSSMQHRMIFHGRDGYFFYKMK